MSLYEQKQPNDVGKRDIECKQLKKHGNNNKKLRIYDWRNQTAIPQRRRNTHCPSGKRQNNRSNPEKKCRQLTATPARIHQLTIDEAKLVSFSWHYSKKLKQSDLYQSGVVFGWKVNKTMYYYYYFSFFFWHLQYTNTHAVRWMRQTKIRIFFFNWQQTSTISEPRRAPTASQWRRDRVGVNPRNKRLNFLPIYMYKSMNYRRSYEP